MHDLIAIIRDLCAGAAITLFVIAAGLWLLA